MCTILFIGVVYDQSKPVIDQLRAPLYSEQDMLEALWERYKSNYIESATGRTVDRQRNDVTTSEGQSYTMLRAVWMDDKETFDRAWRWTKDNLRKNSFLFAWKFGEKEDGSYGVLTEEGGNTSATDGDTDIALALFLAYGRWGNELYATEAREILNAVWEYEVVIINNKPYLLANDIEKSTDKEELIINPSYFSPYAYRIFAFFDPEHNWGGLVDTSYEILIKSMDTPTKLPPNWLTLNKETADIQATRSPNLTTHYGYDAIRIPWRIALDYIWFENEEALSVLSNFNFLKQEWLKNKQIGSVYSQSGEVISDSESFSMYGTSIAYFSIVDKKIAQEIHNTKLFKNYDVDKFKWYKDPGYYGDNWGWFGLALYHGRLFNYTEFLLTQ